MYWFICTFNLALRRESWIVKFFNVKVHQSNCNCNFWVKRNGNWNIYRKRWFVFKWHENGVEWKCWASKCTWFPRVELVVLEVLFIKVTLYCITFRTFSHLLSFLCGIIKQQNNIKVRYCFPSIWHHYLLYNEYHYCFLWYLIIIFK